MARPGFGRRRRWFVAIGTIVVVLLLVMVVFKDGVGHQVRKSAVATTIAKSLIQEYRVHLTSRSIIDGYLRTHSPRKLQIGAGKVNLEGWLNTDIEPARGQAYLDATKAFPLPDRSVNYVFSEHLIEHLTYEDGLSMLKETYRVPTPGGKVRIATPNLLKLVQLFQDAKTDEMWRYMRGEVKYFGWPDTPTPECHVLNMELREWGHQFVYDEPTLRDSLARAGFEMIVGFPIGESDDRELEHIEARPKGGALVRELTGYETMALQAVKR
jgi:predicted SAM-dependent methyltransferase